jgi:hypothetical protein
MTRGMHSLLSYPVTLLFIASRILIDSNKETWVMKISELDDTTVKWYADKGDYYSTMSWEIIS